MQSISLEEKSIQTLELPAVLERLSRQCVTATARESAEALRPAGSAVEIRKLLEETSAAKTMMVVRGSPSFSGVKDVRSSLSRADLGGALNTRELTDIAGVLQCARLVRRYVSDDSVGHTCIDYLFSALRANRPLEEKITSSIVGEDEIADGASSELADIRRKMRAAASRAREALNKIISSSSYAKALQEPIITMRSDRYVVPVKAEHKNAVPGLVHDISSSGATLFIEPMGAVKANNELRELAAREKLEIERILMELSAECAANREEISSDFEILTRLDLIFAKAKLSYDLNGMEPEITESNIVLNHARHPLLPKDTTVPIDVSLGEDFDTLVITGPNTGGKTVTLKTIGLLCLMAKCGLHIPVDDGSKICVFDHVFADIGDEQSIEQNLSTFSAHMTNIVRILEECSDHSLILFDELGAGTDPTEGAALAISVIEHCRKKGAMIAATTHYAELKVYATEQKRVQNASCEFDVETLRPTYKLLVGIPGKSNAFAISTRLGLPSEIIDDAKSRIGTDSASFEATIEKLEQTRLSMEKEREEARRIRKQAEEDAKASKRLKAELSVRLEKADERSRREAERIIEDARKTAEKTFEELDEMRRQSNKDQDAQRINEARNIMRRSLNEKQAQYQTKAETEEDKKSSRKLRPGDVVEVKSMGGVNAVVQSVTEDGTVLMRAGIMNIQAKEDEVYLLEGAKIEEKTPVKAGNRSIRAAAVPSEVDLRGMDSVEAVMTAERYLDNAVMGKMNQVTIIHGKGTGALRKAIHAMLKKNKAVKSFRLGTFGEGEAGVTIVELK